MAAVHKGESMTKMRSLFLWGICMFTLSKAEASLLYCFANLTDSQVVLPSTCTFDGAPCFGTVTLTLITATDAFRMSLIYTTGNFGRCISMTAHRELMGPSKCRLRGVVPCPAASGPGAAQFK
jgi:hypothetical protein